VVAVLAGGGDPREVARALAAGPAAPEDLRPRVAPDADIVAAVAAEIGTDSLFGTLRRIERSVLRRDDPNYRLGDLSTQIAIAAAVDGVRLPLLDRWTYALCPVDERDEGVARLADWAVEHAMGGAVPPPRAGRLPPPERAGQDALRLAERVHRRLVAWRWMALRFPRAYREVEAALAESRRLNGWIEAVLAADPSGQARGAAEGGPDPGGRSAAGGTDGTVGRRGGEARTGRGSAERAGAGPRRSGEGARPVRRARDRRGV
jgi:ATP-dependent RNA helicase SUPV3L1/SUV3